MQNPPKACLEPAGPHAPKGWRGAAKLSAGFGEQRGWRNPSCVVTPQNLRVWGRMRRCAARRGLQGRCPLWRPPPLPPEKTAPPNGGVRGAGGGGWPRSQGRGRPRSLGGRGGKGEATHARPPLALHRAARRARSGRGFAGAAGRCGRAAPAGGPRLPPAAIGPARPGSAPSGGPGPAAPYPFPAFKPPVPAGRSVRGSTGGDDPLRAVSTAPGTCGTGNRYRLRPRRAPAAVPGVGGAGDGGGGTAVTRAGRIGAGNNAAVTAGGCGHRGCGGKDWGWGTPGCDGVRGVGRRAAL